MKLTEKLAKTTNGLPFYTFEFFPPRTEQGFTNLLNRIERMSSLGPLAVSVTWSAGGSSKDRSLQLASLCQSEHKVETILHLTCTNMQSGMVYEALKNAKENGIQNILALRGDPPRGEEYWIACDSRFNKALDLVRYIKESPEFKDYFCVGVAGRYFLLNLQDLAPLTFLISIAYPDGHNESSEDEDTQIQYLKEKVDAGADFIVTQLFYDVQSFIRWQEKVRAKGITVPILPGIMPLQSYASFVRLTKLCGTRVPESLQDALLPIKHDDQLVKDLGVNLAVSMIRQLHQSGIQGFHFCTLNLEKSVQLVLETLGWVNQHPTTMRNQLISESPVIQPNQPQSIPSELLITPSEALATASSSLPKHSHLAVSDGPSHSAGKGELISAATWDEFPNGRFGDYKSPAFGVQDLWDSSSLGISRQQAILQWGQPKTKNDITAVFVAYLKGKIQSTPWSDEPLAEETSPILNWLERLNKDKGWWTVGSQPAVDAVSSSDNVFGWGPRGGYVFQKAFVEFFAEEKDVKDIIEKIEARGQGSVTYFAANAGNNFATNMPDEGSNAVTWGVFPGQEIAASTAIEQDSFLAWKDEAFGYWTEWSLFYPPDSTERKLLESIRNQRWLISVVHHNFKSPDSLWSFLLTD